MPTATPSAGAQRAGLANTALVRFTVAHSLAVMAEWGIFIAALVAVFERDGAIAAGFGSIAMQLGYIAFAPVAGSLTVRHQPHLVRTGGLAAQTSAFAACAAAAVAGLGSAAVITFATLAIGAVTTLRPSGAALLPAIVRSSRELTVANLWIGYADGVALIGGPLVMTVLLVLGGAELAIAGCAVLAGLATLCSPDRNVAVVRPPVTDEALGALAQLRAHLRHVTARPGVAGVLAIAGAQHIMLGAMDMIVVVVAEDHIDLGDGGAGVLVTLFGIGALLGGLLTTALVRRQRLAPMIAIAVGMMGVASIAFGAVVTVTVAVTAMLAVGISRSVVDRLSCLLLHRSAPPEALAAVFTVIEFASGVGLFAGAILAQILVAVSGVEAALVGVGACYIVLLALTLRPLAVADASADVPTVAMSLLRRTPVFRLLPRHQLEDLGRAAEEISAERGDEIITQGDLGDRFYVVADGRFEARIDGERVGSIGRGGCFGEVALLADAPRMATVTAATRGDLLAIDRAPFLLAVTGHDSTSRAAWDVVDRHRRHEASGALDAADARPADDSER